MRKCSVTKEKDVVEIYLADSEMQLFTHRPNPSGQADYYQQFRQGAHSLQE
ncbi:hypothetical protein P5673_025998 [Acropora cervicornis]|uniref:Uncharacterized protein n=1 Tax=Acropora cervicornis TaxID=6130 RepID=A0AAD9UX52_ACRCE|nr:hypothetical protein P5673_025998 [Acropora cervicornis]